jgi:hypothetical protein
MHQFTNCLSQFLDKQFVNLCSFKIDSHIFVHRVTSILSTHNKIKQLAKKVVTGNKTPKATYSVCTDTKYRGI